MKRNDALTYVIKELRLIKKNILENKSVSPTRFLELSEIFKFKIEPASDRFDALCLTEIVFALCGPFDLLSQKFALSVLPVMGL